MTCKAPGKARREGISSRELIRLFPGDATAGHWFAGIVRVTAGERLRCHDLIVDRGLVSGGRA